MLLAPSPARAGGLDRVQRSGVLRWGGDLQGGEPYVYRDPSRPGRLAGFEVDLAEALARELGVRHEFVQNDWSSLVPSLERGAFDVVMNGLEITEARAGSVLYSRPYYVFAERLVRRRGDASIVPSLDALRGRRVGTLTSSLAFEMLRGRAEPVLYEGVEEPYLDLIGRRTDAVLLDDIIASRYGGRHPELEVAGDVGAGMYAIGVSTREPDLLAGIDRALSAVIASGELERILRRHELWNERQGRLANATTSEPRDAGPSSPTRHPLEVTLFFQGAAMTLVVSVLAMAVAVALGLALALARGYGPRWASFAASAYVEVYRGTPVLLQLYVLYYGLAPVLRIDALTAAALGLGMNYAAYEAEVYRAGISAVPRGQMEAALALGMTPALALRRVVLPQAMRVALPAMTNDFIALLKDTALVSVITVVELTKQMTISAVDTRGWLLPGLLCAALYFAMSYPLSRLARSLETRLARA